MAVSRVGAPTNLPSSLRMVRKDRRAITVGTSFQGKDLHSETILTKKDLDSREDAKNAKQEHFLVEHTRHWQARPPKNI